MAGTTLLDLVTRRIRIWLTCVIAIMMNYGWRRSRYLHENFSQIYLVIKARNCSPNPAGTVFPGTVFAPVGREAILPPTEEIDVERDGVGVPRASDSGEPGGEEPDPIDGATCDDVDEARRREGILGLLDCEDNGGI